MRLCATEGVVLTTIVTNIWVLGPTNLPILAALWATKTFIADRQTASIKFVKRFPLIKDVKPNDIFVGSEDTLTRAEKSMMNGRMVETFPAILKKYATEVDRCALEDLSLFVQNSHPGKTIGHALAPSASRQSQAVITHTGLEAILCGLKALYPHGGDVHFSRMTEIFEGLRRAGRNRLQTREAALNSELFHNGKIAMTSRSTFSPVHGALFQDFGVRVIIFNDGYNLGVLRHPNEKIKLDDPRIIALIDAAGERQDWSLTTSGGLLHRGTPENRKLEHSRVNKHKLTDTLASLLEESSHKVRALDRSEA